MTRIKGTPAQLKRLRDDSFRDAEKALKLARNSRKAAQDTARNIQERQWNMAYHADRPDGYWARMREDKDPWSYLERSMLRDLNIARDAEEAAEVLLRKARQAAYQYTLTQKHYIEPPWEGLLTLIRMCRLGLKNKRARRERSLQSIYHLQ